MLITILGMSLQNHPAPILQIGPAFKDTEDANKGKFGGSTTNATVLREKKNWDKKLGQGREKSSKSERFIRCHRHLHD
jgi:hypothetical protein